jgi:tetratricopeptide (TPR) repeat protein
MKLFCGVRGIWFLFLLTSGSFVCAIEYTDTIPAWLIPLRNAVYEQSLNSTETKPLYEAALQKADQYSGAERDILKARCEYFMGRVYQYYHEEEAAERHYERAERFAVRSLEIKETAQGWEMYAAAVSQLCMLRSPAWVMTHGLNVEKFSRNALRLDTRNAPARFMIASRWVYAPWPFGDPQKGINMMNGILDGHSDLQKDDLFNIYIALSYANFRVKNPTEAENWRQKALGLFPANKFARHELPARF